MSKKTDVGHAMTKAEAADIFERMARITEGEMREASLLATAALRRSVRSTRAAKKAAIEKRKAARAGVPCDMTNRMKPAGTEGAFDVCVA